MKHSGFSLVEFLIYLALSAFVIMIFMRFAGFQIIAMHTYYKTMMQRINTAYVAYIIQQELQKVPINKESWKDIKEEAPIWHTQQDYSISINKGNLYWIEGSYNIFKKKWSKKSRNLIAERVEKIRIILEWYKPIPSEGEKLKELQYEIVFAEKIPDIHGFIKPLDRII